MRSRTTFHLIFSTCLLATGCRVASRTVREGGVAFEIVPITPAERAALLSPCPPMAPAPANWSAVNVTPVPGVLRLPQRLAEQPAPVPTSAEQLWADSTLGVVWLERDDDAGRSSGFKIFPGDEPLITFVDEGACAVPIAGRLAQLRRSFWVSESQPAETTFVAMTDIPLGGSLQLGAGVSSWFRRGRDSLLVALATLELPAR